MLPLVRICYSLAKHVGHKAMFAHRSNFAHKSTSPSKMVVAAIIHVTMLIVVATRLESLELS